ncbi:uncharacterized protein VTP21DRAFT_3753 [Calcarisporiella thermophila]|uniref:uncharacterized protein n=1 Tax=Calcarisporiella thermophila TaxID=911321 RepID=UPI0037427274
MPACPPSSTRAAECFGRSACESQAGLPRAEARPAQPPPAALRFVVFRSRWAALLQFSWPRFVSKRSRWQHVHPAAFALPKRLADGLSLDVTCHVKLNFGS